MVVQENERGMESVSIFLNYGGRGNSGVSVLKQYGLSFMFARVRLCVVVDFNPPEGDDEERGGL